MTKGRSTGRPPRPRCYARAQISDSLTKAIELRLGHLVPTSASKVRGEIFAKLREEFGNELSGIRGPAKVQRAMEIIGQHKVEP